MNCLLGTPRDLHGWGRGAFWLIFALYIMCSMGWEAIYICCFVSLCLCKLVVYKQKCKTEDGLTTTHPTQIVCNRICASFHLLMALVFVAKYANVYAGIYAVTAIAMWCEKLH